jgi:hypothetical protein
MPGEAAFRLLSRTELPISPGVPQQLTVTIADSAQRAWGFQLTARPSTSSKTQAGTFASLDANTPVVGTGWQTVLTYGNYSPQAVTRQTNFLFDDGTPSGGAHRPRGLIHSHRVAPFIRFPQPTLVRSEGGAQGQCTGPVKASMLFRLI